MMIVILNITPFTTLWAKSADDEMTVLSYLSQKKALGNRVTTFLCKSCQLCLPSVHFVAA